uniref:ShTK domain protein n=1 Tax=Haemonchus contortus TaxID=6289 RepID=A0A7I4YTB5_HAECO
MFVQLLLVTLLSNHIVAQTCTPEGSFGPCANGQCAPGFTCLIDINECCSDDAIITTVATVASDATTATTVAGQTGATVSTVSSATGSVTSSSTASSSTCVDKLNPKTGVSDCPQRASLCNDATYYAVMTDQCPKTCGRCSGSGSGSTNSTCVDKINPTTGVSDCPALSYLCNNADYTALMTDQCPLTCNRCSSTNSTTSPSTNSTTCVDLTNPTTGVSDCPQRTALCTDSNYISLMRTQCPKTCGFCSSASTGTGTAATSAAGTASTVSTGCVDAINPRTGTSDCPQRASLCTDSNYRDLMSTQCRKTCGLC